MEMNAHLPQSYQTMEEIRALAGVSTQIISARECKPIVAIVQDIALGVYRITKPHVQLSQKNFYNILATNERFNGIAPPPAITNGDIKTWTGRQVLSTIIPQIINVDMCTNSYDETKSRAENIDNIITVKNGQIHSGVFDKDVYQSRTKGLVHSIYNECGPEETRIFLDNTQKYICNFLVLDGFSVGVSDLITDVKTQNDFKDAIHKMKIDVYNTINKVHAGTLENVTTKNDHEYFELTVNGILNKANKEVGDTGLQRIDPYTNRLINMIKSKSKGTNINVAQMIGCVGQVNIEGRRIANGFDDRTLPHYAKYDDGPESRGFVENSFIKGLTPQEFFFHAMGGREGLIDTAVGTSETGYIQRKLVKAMEDCKVNFDGSVRNASGAIVQFLYGDDGMDPSKIESQAIPYFDMDIEKVMYDYQFTDDLKAEALFMESKLLSQLKKEKSWRAAHNKHVQQILEDKEFLIVKVLKCKNESSVMYPISFMRIITNTAGMHERYGGNTVSDLHPAYALEEIAKLEEEIIVNPHHKGTHLFRILLRAYMSPKRLIMRYRMSKAAFDAIIAQVKYRFYESLAHPSEMVGVVAAQSLGEPATQLTLNSVAYDTELLLNMGGKYTRVKIGEYIDTIIAKGKRLEDHPNDTKLAWLDEPVTVPSCDEVGKISWKRVEAVTRHPVVNKDGTNTVLKVTTKSGREVIATKAKSFLKRVDNKIMQVEGEDLRVGDYLPVSMTLPVDQKQIITSLDLSLYLPKSEYVHISEKFILDSEFGFFIGAYLAKGMIEENNKILIANVSDEFDSRVSAFIKNLGMEASILEELLSEICGNSSVEKRIPEFVYQAPDTFVKGLIDGYFSGEGHIHKKTLMVASYSVSHGLLVDLSALLTRYQIKSSITEHANSKRPYASLYKGGWNLVVQGKCLIQFAQQFTLTVKYKNVAFKKLAQKQKQYDINDYIPNVKLSGSEVTIKRGELDEYISQAFDNAKDLAILNNIKEEEIFYDQVVNIQEISNPTHWVYDLTVEETRNFNIHNSLAMADKQYVGNSEL